MFKIPISTPFLLSSHLTLWGNINKWHLHTIKNLLSIYFLTSSQIIKEKTTKCDTYKHTILYRALTTRTPFTVPTTGLTDWVNILLVSPQRGAVAAHQCLLSAAGDQRGSSSSGGLHCPFATTALWSKLRWLGAIWRAARWKICSLRPALSGETEVWWRGGCHDLSVARTVWREEMETKTRQPSVGNVRW